MGGRDRKTANICRRMHITKCLPDGLPIPDFCPIRPESHALWPIFAVFGPMPKGWAQGLSRADGHVSVLRINSAVAEAVIVGAALCGTPAALRMPQG
jgi:hypothetical protein